VHAFILDLSYSSHKKHRQYGVHMMSDSSLVLKVLGFIGCQAAVITARVSHISKKQRQTEMPAYCAAAKCFWFCWVAFVMIQLSSQPGPHLSPNSSATGRTRHGGCSLAIGTCRGTARPWTQAPLLLAAAAAIDAAFGLAAAADDGAGLLLRVPLVLLLLLLVLAVLCVLQQQNHQGGAAHSIPGEEASIPTTYQAMLL
jgi:hypothetical protein